jgi:hypothetical protein
MMGQRTFRAFGIMASAAVVLAASWLATARAQEMTIAPQFESAGNFHRGVAAAKEGGLWGLIDKSGKWIVKPTYQDVTAGGEGFFGVQLGDKWGYVDTKGAMVIQPQYEAVGLFVGAYAPARANGLWGYIATDGKTSLPFEFSELAGWEGDIFIAKGKEGWFVAVRDSSGQVYPYSSSFPVIRYFNVSEDSAVAEVPGGQMLVLFRARGREDLYLSIRKRSQGLSAASRTKDKWGYIDGEGQFLWPDRFEEAGEFTESLAPAKTAGKWGYIDRSAAFVVAPSHDEASSFRDGWAVVRTGELRGFLKNDPQRGIYEFIKPTYQDAYLFTEGLAPVKVGDKWGYVSSGRREPIIEDVVDVVPPQ